MSHDDFIEVYENALPRAFCTSLVQRFNASAEAKRGSTGGGVDVSHKNSWDIGLVGKPQWAAEERALNEAMLAGLLQYVRKYAYAILGPHWLNLVDPATGVKKALDPEAVAALPDDTLRAVVTKVFRPGPVNLQKYLAAAFDVVRPKGAIQPSPAQRPGYGHRSSQSPEGAIQNGGASVEHGKTSSAQTVIAVHGMQPDHCGATTGRVRNCGRPVLLCCS